MNVVDNIILNVLTKQAKRYNITEQSTLKCVYNVMRYREAKV